MEEIRSLKKKASEIKELIFILTTYCNLKCRECVANIPRIVSPEHYGIKYIENAVSYFRGIDHVIISGGEPTAHPEFQQIVLQLKEIFGCRLLSLVTNGYNVIKYANVLHHFDDIRISHYTNNPKEVEFLKKNFIDSSPPGPTIHLSTARRARNPVPCSRANTVKYMYGRLYPCCVVPDGLEGIGIPLTQNWREEILKIEFPCEDCCFAEEGEPNMSEVNVADRWAMTHRRKIEEDKEREPVWPSPRDDIAIYGLHLDSWMSREALVRINPPKGATRLVIYFESYAPENLHPIMLTFENEHSKDLFTHIVKKPGKSKFQLKLQNILIPKGNTIIKVLCDKTFIPCRLNPEYPDARELGIRIVSLHYK